VGRLFELTGYEWSFDKKEWHPIARFAEFGVRDKSVYIRRCDLEAFSVDTGSATGDEEHEDVEIVEILPGANPDITFKEVTDVPA
jgi:hypothetical protein